MKAVRIEKNIKEQIRIIYPWIGIATKDAVHDEGTIVLFTEEGKGVVICQNELKSYSLGGYGFNWLMDRFTEYKGEIKLSN